METVLKMTGIVALGILLAALLWFFGASDALASTDSMTTIKPAEPLNIFERANETPNPTFIILERLVKQGEKERKRDARDKVLQLFFPDLHFLKPAMIGEVDLKRELAELEEEE